jgi:hypothetical protein
MNFSFLILLLKISLISSHGYLEDPISRSSAWLQNDVYGEVFPQYFLHNQMNCGSFETFVKNSKINKFHCKN